MKLTGAIIINWHYDRYRSPRHLAIVYAKSLYLLVKTKINKEFKGELMKIT